MEGSRVNDVTLSRGRLRVGKHITKVSVTSLGADLGSLHVVRSIQALGQEIFRDGLGKGREADAGVEFVDRTYVLNDGDVIAIMPPVQGG
jgi:molybdopterin converting factor small subunit